MTEFKKLNLTQKLPKLKKELHLDHNNKYITSQEFNRLTAKKFTARLKLANLATKVDIVDFVEKANFYDKLKSLSKKVTSNKTKYVEAEEKLTDITKKDEEILEEEYYFLFGRIYFTGDVGYQNFLDFIPMLKSLILDSNKKVTYWIWTRI